MSDRDTATILGLGLVTLAGALALNAARIVPDNLPDARLALGFAILALLGLAVGFGWEDGAARPLRRALLWGTGAVAILAALVFHSDAARAATRVLKHIAPAQAAAAPEPPPLPASMPAAPGPNLADLQSVTLQATANGHFFANALVNGVPISFLVDTGSTDVALSPSDARALGIDVGKLDYSEPVFTANGPIRVAVVELKTVTLGPLHVENVTASIPQVELRHSLLGMSFLKRLTQFSMDTDRLVLTQ